MKKLAKKFLLALFVVFGTFTLAAQDSTIVIAKNMKVKKRTVLERFDTDMVKSAEERTAMKEARLAKVKKLVSILDTFDISERRRDKIFRDLIQSPFSDRVSKIIVELKFEDEEIE